MGHSTLEVTGLPGQDLETKESFGERFLCKKGGHSVRRQKWLKRYELSKFGQFSFLTF